VPIVLEVSIELIPIIPKPFTPSRAPQLVYLSMFLFSYLGPNFHAQINIVVFHYHFGYSLVQLGEKMHGNEV
jgi:hypothetical protein